VKIAMVSEHASPLATLGGADAGGQNVHVDALARALAARGHEVVVHTRRDDPDLPASVELAPGVTVHHVDAGPASPVPKDELVPYLPAFTKVLAQQWYRDRPDIVHSHFWMSGVAAHPAATDVGVPLVVTFHALGSVKQRHQAAADTSPPVRIGAERALLRHADRVVATAQEELFELRMLGARDQRIEVVPCGVDVDHFTPGPAWRPREKAPFRLLSLSRLVPRKGVDDAIEMLAELPECELTVAGGPPVSRLDSDREVRRLRARADALGVGDRVTFIGSVPRSAVPALIRSADVVVALPWYEPFGIVPLEAMACGRPVVGSAVGGLLDTVVDGMTGLLVPPRSPYAAALAVRGLIASPQLRETMGQAGREHVEERFTWPAVAAQTERVYASVLARARLRLVAEPALARAATAGGAARPLALASGAVPAPAPAPVAGILGAAGAAR
jgi:glycosyltransferase involved in cell wall biosynthesis